MAQNYPRLGIVEFGRQLFDSRDLDPVYVALKHAIGHDALSSGWLPRFLVAYWCFYSAGFACYAAQFYNRKEYWVTLREAAANDTLTPFNTRWPRASERRHFRGQKAVNAVQALAARYDDPQNMIEFIMDGPDDVSAVIKRAASHAMFGPWIGFKIADMLDMLGYSVDQSDVSAFLYDTPRESIRTSYPGFEVGVMSFDAPSQYEAAMEWLTDALHAHGCRNPHKYGELPDRFCVETVWCKHLSHLHGHYPLYRDTVELYTGVQPWVRYSPIAEAFKAGLPAPPKFSIGGSR